ncbi:MAG: 16S rRNA (cytosine(1402)-N(4))-methyltransferase RsmH [Candidatus Loosdrechtia sp.]|uniref:16S rRNA (cytosine(1402)-N(4))-methyltransferase n=1 Tax=Candidatus Loosdrechtia sp. TaxID=3101272 RepID=UPI003A612743|nr:MAG: 16S rRNA (cytosine(1402)-N(4))-methyltransferase RsmH [Candidatus Jettenia sp. AMX2]
MKDTGNRIPHIPVMIEEVMEYLCPEAGQIILDCTVGSGGHACRILEKIKPDGLLIGIDRDLEILQTAKRYLSETGGVFKLYHADYAEVDEVLKQAAVEKVHGVLLDLGASSLQFDMAERGFSFCREGPLDMRMDRSRGVTAFDLIQRLSERELEGLFRKYGEERWSGRIARAIIHAKKKGITSTRELAALIERVVPSGRSKIHPATRVFQALRIAVNRELESLEIFLDKIFYHMAVDSRIVIISFHSLEDRIVKNKFREKANQKIAKILTRRPLSPSKAEIVKNIRSRSAKLRAAERSLL